MADIRGNTAAGASAGASIGMHLSTDLPKCPTGGDTKSTQIATELNAFIDAAHTEINTYNQSVGALRAGTTAAPKGVDATDQSGADIVNSSGQGGTYTI